MREIRVYSNIWNVGKVIYSLSDFKLPFPVEVSQMVFFISSLFFVIVFKNIPPFSLTNNFLIKYLAIPLLFTWFMSKKTFDGKSPFSFFKSVLTYYFRPKTTYGGKRVDFSSQENFGIIKVRSENYITN